MRCRHPKTIQPIFSLNNLMFSSVILATAITPITAALAFGSPWKPRQTLNIQGGRGVEEYYDVLLPISGDADRMFYTNGAFNNSQNTIGGELGLGYRQIAFHNHYVLGGYVLFDRYRTDYQNMYNQLTYALEGFGTIWEGRTHLYQPISRKRQFAGSKLSTENSYFQAHKYIAVQTNVYEIAEGGADVEVGHVIPGIPKLRGFAGYYHLGLGRDDKNIDGGYARFEYRINHHFTFTVADGYNQTYGNQFMIGLRMSMGSPEAKEPLTADQRMTDYSVRRRDVFTYLNSKSSVFISPENFYFVTNKAGASTMGNGTYETPYLTVPEAVFAANNDGNTYKNYVYIYNYSNQNYNLGGQLNAGHNVGIYGSGADFIYRGKNVLPKLTAPTLVGSFYLPGNNELANFNLTGLGTTENIGILASGNNITINNLNISDYKGKNGIDGVNGIDATPATGAPDFDPSIPATAGTNGTDGDSAYGIFINNSSNVLINGVTVSNITGGNAGFGGNGGDGSSSGSNTQNALAGGDGGSGGSGGNANGISIINSNTVSLSKLNISGLQGGNGNIGGNGGIGGTNSGLPPFSGYSDGGDGGNGGNGGNGGSVTGIILNSVSTLSISSINLTGSFNAGTAAMGGSGGDGGNGYRDAYNNPGSGNGSGGNGGNSGNGGNGGNAYGVQSGGAAPIQVTSTATLNATTGVAGNTGGTGGDAVLPINWGGTDGSTGTTGSTGSNGTAAVVAP